MEIFQRQEDSRSSIIRNTSLNGLANTLFLIELGLVLESGKIFFQDKN
jgi:hypothetical protein